MENIKIKNTSSYQNLKYWESFWHNELGRVENKLILNPNSFFLQCQKKLAKQRLNEAINNLSDYLFKYGK